MVDRVLAIGAGAPDLILDAGPISGVLPDLLRITGGDGKRVVTVSNHGPVAEELGMRNSFEGELRYGVLGGLREARCRGAVLGADRAHLRFRRLARGARPQPEWESTR